METPTSNTPVPKCLSLAAYAYQTMSQFAPGNVVLQELAGKMNAARTKLAQAESAYLTADAQMIPMRVNLTLANYDADEGIKQCKRTAEHADGETNGPLVTHLFPNGTTPIVRPFGAAQIKEMRDLEGRYDGLIERWADAQIEKDKATALRQRYEQALQARTDAAQNVNNMRSLRDLAKKDFLDAYAEVANRIRALFPRNKKKQDLFFDTVTERASAESNSEKAVA